MTGDHAADAACERLGGAIVTQAHEGREPGAAGQDGLGAVAVPHRCGDEPDGEQQTERVGDDEPLALTFFTAA
jgi:hypothetical protein